MHYPRRWRWVSSKLGATRSPWNCTKKEEEVSFQTAHLKGGYWKLHRFPYNLSPYSFIEGIFCQQDAYHCQNKQKYPLKNFAFLIVQQDLILSITSYHVFCKGFLKAAKSMQSLEKSFYESTHQCKDQGAAICYILLHHLLSVYQLSRDLPRNPPKEAMGYNIV